MAVQLVLVLFLIPFVLTGTALFLKGVLDLRTLFTMSRTGVTDIHSLGKGLHGIEGRVEKHRATVTAPLTETECLGYEVTIERYSPNDDGSNWHTVHTATEIEQFVLDDGTGRVTVGPDNADVTLENSLRDVVSGDESPPPAFQRYLDGIDVEHDSHDEGGGFIARLGSDKHRFTEGRLDIGEETYVLGPVRRDPGTATSLTVASFYADGRLATFRQQLAAPFLIGDSDLSDLRTGLLLKGGFFTLFGLVFGGIPLLILLP